jgi:hypothetical protein
MNILLIGHSIIDHIDESGLESIKPGGIFYSLTGMLAVKRNEDKIYLLTCLNENNRMLFYNYNEADLTFSSTSDEMPEVFLRQNENEERGETYKNISSRLSIEKIFDWKFFDGILINMITGLDISVEQLEIIRKSFPGLIYFDVHTLSRGVDVNMNRLFRPIPEIEKWLVNIDVLQCNENELKTIFDCEQEIAAEKILNIGVKILIVTKGEKGVTAYFKEDSKIANYSLHAENVKVINKIGCGDIFGAFFFYSYLRGGNIPESLKLANKAAGITVANNIIDSPHLLKIDFK